MKFQKVNTTTSINLPDRRYVKATYTKGKIVTLRYTPLRPNFKADTTSISFKNRGLYFAYIQIKTKS